MPLIYAGQGVHYAQAWNELRQVAELLEAPVCTSMEGKSAFPETHPLALGAGGNTSSRALATHVRESDVVFGVGVSFSPGYSIRWPTAGKRFIHNTVEERDLDKIVPAAYPVLGDSKLTLAMLHQALSERLRGRPRGLTRAGRRAHPGAERALDGRLDAAPDEQREAAVAVPGPLRPDADRRRGQHHRHARRRQPARRDDPVLEVGDAAQLSSAGARPRSSATGSASTMGAKVAHPEKLCINFWGEAAIGMTGMDFETCVRCQIPVMSILSNNFGMKTEYAAMKLSHEKYRTCDISGNYADFAKAMGGYGERVTEPEQVVHAIVNGIRATREGKPVLLEFITTQEVRYSSGGAAPVETDPRRGRGEIGTAMIISKTHLDRRTFLRGMGATVALPLLDAMIPAGTRARGHCRTPCAAPGVRVLPARRDHGRVDAGQRRPDRDARPDPRAACAVRRPADGRQRPREPARVRPGARDHARHVAVGNVTARGLPGRPWDHGGSDGG